MWCWHFETFIWWLIHKTARFLRSKNRKWFFGATTRKTFSCNIVRHPRMHMHAQYGHVITNYAAILAITLAIWTESNETSNMVAHFEKDFLRCNQYTKFGILLATVSHKMTPRERFTLFGQFLNILCQFQTMVKMTGMKVLR